MAFLSPLREEDKTDQICLHVSTMIKKKKIKIMSEMKSAKRTLPILSNSVDKDDVVGLADGDFGRIR